MLSSLFSVKLKNLINLPVSITHSEAYDLPTYLPGTDIDLQTAVQSRYDQIFKETGNAGIANYYANQLKISSENMSVTNRIALNGMKFNLNGDNFFIQEVLNKIEINY